MLQACELKWENETIFATTEYTSAIQIIHLRHDDDIFFYRSKNQI